MFLAGEYEMRLLVLIVVLLMVSPAVGQQLKEITNCIGMKLVLIHAGSFTMGSPEEAVGRLDGETQHEVTISRSYYLGVYEVTQAQYEKVVGENNSRPKVDKLPAEVNWYNADTFCAKLSKMPEEKAEGREYRLPTEAEWEYACRASSAAAYQFGDSKDVLNEYAWFSANAGNVPHPVGEKKPNRWGLYDMLGNAFEWCQDTHGEYPSEAVTDPIAQSPDAHRIIRGGCYGTGALECRSAFRSYLDPRMRGNILGFRVALSLPIKQAESVPSK